MSWPYLHRIWHIENGGTVLTVTGIRQKTTLLGAWLPPTLSRFKINIRPSVMGRYVKLNIATHLRHSNMDFGFLIAVIGKVALSIHYWHSGHVNPLYKMKNTGAFLHRAHYARLLFFLSGNLVFGLNLMVPVFLDIGMKSYIECCSRISMQVSKCGMTSRQHRSAMCTTAR